MKVSLPKILKGLLVALLVAACAYILWPGFANYNRQGDEVKRLEAEVRELKAERATLEERRKALEAGDPELIEKLAREKIPMSKPDEVVFRFKK